MHAETLSDTSRRSAELRFVTSHFRNLQGLRFAPFWLSFMVLTGLAASGLLSSRDLAWAAFGITALNFGLYFAICLWYSRRFGVVKAPDAAVPSGLISIMNPEARTRVTATYPNSFDVVFMMWILEMAPSLFGHVDRDSGLFCLIALGYGLLPRVAYSRSEVGLVRVRRCASMAATLILGLSYLDCLHRGNGRWQFLGSLFATLLSLDIYDHWLLTRLLSGAHSGATNG